ncbi:MAG: lipoprotein [Pigmentiphaga sp.]|uniref:LPS translocon maturation chaperone LptM n=1 Tax=Pigmentiphaga sp. TaxID=1977564 RepID=UPI0029A37F92|nr:lipoprotein [Pigmentiphaga sp.]MDX3906907.1 lipoprotein [Pigmentiphaga sp.]
MVADTGIVASGTHASRPDGRGRRLAAAAVGAAAAVLMTACGIKGPLYLPQTPPPATRPAAAPAQPAPPPPTSVDANDVSRRNESISHTPLPQ